MFDLARQGSLDLLPYIEAGLPANLTNNRGDTLLMLAAYHGHAELVRAILNSSRSASGRSQASPADPNVLNGRGQSILAGAVFKGHDEVIKLLVEHGADPLAGQPNAEDSAKMFKKWDDEDGRKGLKELFEAAPGRSRGAREAPEAVEDREEQRRIPGHAANQSN
jgi:ankyrin repeat protein